MNIQKKRFLLSLRQDHLVYFLILILNAIKKKNVSALIRIFRAFNTAF